MKYALVLIICLGLYSCNNEGSINRESIIQRFSDSFYTINPYWNTLETTDSSRYEIIEDPVNAENNVLVFHLLPDDFIEGGKRNEFALKTMDSIGYDVHYSFNFLFSPDLFTNEKEQDWIMIHQWHDHPPRGQSWKEYNMQTTPPVHLYVQLLPGDKYYIVYAYGLWDKEKKHVVRLKYEVPLEPNKWYSFDNTIKWEMNESAYSIPIINGEYLVKAEDNAQGKIFGANMYNDVPNYFKMGLYGNYKSKDTVSVYIDDFNYELFLP